MPSPTTRSRLVRQGLLAALLLGSGPTLPAQADEFSSLRQRDYTQIDQHALAAGDQATRTLDGLVAYLVETARDDADKARAIFRWITENIEYDAAGFFSGQYGDLSAEGVLKRRKAVCSGYAELFSRMAKLAGLEVISIRGYVKDVLHQNGEPFADTNHDWSAVRLAGQWYLLEPTWGAGGLDDTGQFKKHFSERYFLVDPGQLAYTHFAADPRWHVADTPSLAVFNAQIRPYEAYHRYGVEARETRQQLTAQCASQTLTFNTPGNVYLRASLERDGHVLSQQALLQRHGNDNQLLVAAPAAGNYTLRLYAKEANAPGHVFEQVVHYTLQFPAGSAFQFPVDYVTFREHGGTLQTPLAGTLSLGALTHFSLDLPGAVEIAVARDAEHWIKLDKRGDHFEGDVEIAGATTVYAKFDDTAPDHLAVLSYSAVTEPVTQACNWPATRARRRPPRAERNVQALTRRCKAASASSTLMSPTSSVSFCSS